MERALHHVRSGYSGVDIISQCQLESVNRNHGFLSFLFQMRNHYLWTLFMHLVVIGHVALSFYESKNKRTDATWNFLGREFYVGVELFPYVSRHTRVHICKCDLRFCAMRTHSD